MTQRVEHQGVTVMLDGKTITEWYEEAKEYREAFEWAKQTVKRLVGREQS